MAIQLNTKQQQVFKQLKNFVKDPVVNTFILNGYAGTGKTFLIQKFAQYLVDKNKNFVLLATTGRAAAILRGKTKFETSTLHSALFRFTKVDGDSDDIPADAPIDQYGQMKLIFAPATNLKNECIYIIDEASMLASEAKCDSSFAIFGSGELLQDFFEAVGSNKIIFVGDTGQLPPINQPFSPALDTNWLHNHGRIAVKATLDKVMRTDADNDILAIASDVRLTPEDLPVHQFKIPALNRKNCTIVNHPNTLFSHYLNAYQESGPLKNIAIAASNKECARLNQYFRKKLFPNSTQEIEINETLMVTQNNQMVDLLNGDFVQVIGLGEKSSHLNLKFQNARVKHLITEKEYNVLISLDAIFNHPPNLTQNQQRLLMIDFSNRMKKKGIKANSEDYHKNMMGDVYLNSLKASYGYIVTCHKSQGGEWDQVFVFMNQIMFKYMSTNAMRKWVYTAITRAKKQLFLHHDTWIS